MGEIEYLIITLFTHVESLARMCCRSGRAVIGQDVLISPEGNKLVPKRPSSAQS